MFMGLRVYETTEAVRTVYNWKDSKHRSDRILKKLKKRFEKQIEYKPAAFIHQKKQMIFIHPTLYRELKSAMFSEEELKRKIHNVRSW